MLSIRRATLDDVGLINKLAWQIFPETYREILSQEQSDYMMEWMYSPESLCKQMKDEGHVYLLAYDDDECVGYVSVQPEGTDLFHLQKIYVLPSAQKMHCGRFLFEQATSYIKSIHPSPCTMQLNVNRSNKALGFYEHMGMHKVRQGDFPIGNGYYMNDYIMAIDL